MWKWLRDFLLKCFHFMHEILWERQRGWKLLKPSNCKAATRSKISWLQVLICRLYFLLSPLNVYIWRKECLWLLILLVGLLASFIDVWALISSKLEPILWNPTLHFRGGKYLAHVLLLPNQSTEDSTNQPWYWWTMTQAQEASQYGVFFRLLLLIAQSWILTWDLFCFI